jgi:deoxyribose-phosphate aldolase
MIEDRIAHVAAVLGLTVTHVRNHLTQFVRAHVLPTPPAALTLAVAADYTNLKAVATPADIDALCATAASHHFGAVCVNGLYVAHASAALQKLQKDQPPQATSALDIRVAAVVGFPLGASTTGIKVAEAQDAFAHGAAEVDNVVPVGRLLAGDYAYVWAELQALRAATPRAVIKTILEVCYLAPEQITDACILCALAGMDMVKTSTGMGTYGARVEDVALMAQVYYYGLSAEERARVDWRNYGIKAAGGIRERPFAEALVEAGATRLGTSSIAAVSN